MDRIAAIENPKLFQIKETLKKQKKNRILLKKRDTSKPSKYKWELKLKDESLNNSDILKDHLIKKPKIIKFASSANLDEEKKNEDKKKKQNQIKDYLKIVAEERKKNEEKRRKREEKEKEEKIKNGEYIEEEDEKQKKANKDQLNDIGNLVQKIYFEKQKADNLGLIAEREQQLLRINGGIKNNPELGKKVTGHLIDSINTKLNILNQFNEN